jgi:predicted membrane metal-binding protein
MYDLSMIFFILYRLIFFIKIFICATLHFFLFLFNKFYVYAGFYYIFYVFFYYNFILIEKFIKHNKINYLCCEIKYFDILLSLNFFTASQY